MRREFSPVPVVHVRLEEGELSAPQAGTLYILWARGVPVGEYFAPTVVDPLALKAAWRKAERTAVSLAKRPPPRQALPSSVTVVICTRDRPDELARCLASFKQQSRQPDELVVVDNASREPERVRAAAEAAGARYVLESRPGLDRARNAGARIARSEIVAYTDDDVILDPCWLENLVAGFTEDDIWAVTGLVLPAELETEAQWIFERQWGFGRGFQRIDFTPDLYDSLRRHCFPAWIIGAGASMAFRRHVFDTVGLFDERLDVGAAGCSGDSEFWNRIIHHGGTCRYEPTSVAFHFHRRDMEGLKRQIRAYMSGHVAALLVQYERTGESGNLRRLTRQIPKHYLRSLVSRMGGRTLTNAMVFQEIPGLLDGIRFYRRAERPADAVRVPRQKPRPLPLPEEEGEAPLVGVVVPAYNASATLDATLRSIRAQTYQRLDIIVVNDGSTDDTAALAARHAAEDSRIRVVSQPNQGLAAARNRGIRETRAEFIAPVDADDLCHPEKFELQVRQFLKAGPHCALVYGWSDQIDEQDRIISPVVPCLEEGYVLPRLLAGNFIGNGSSPMMRRSVVEEFGCYDTTLRDNNAQGCEDLKLYLQIAEHYDVAVVPRVLTGYRITHRSMSSDICQMIESHRQVVAPFAQRYPEYEEQVRVGHVFLALYYAQRALRVGNFRRAYAAVSNIFRYDARLCLKTPLMMLATLRLRLLLMKSFRRLGLGRYEMFATPREE